MRGGKIPTYIGIGLLVSMAIYAWTVLGSAPRTVPSRTVLPPTPTDTPAPWWYFATPMMATNTPEPTPKEEVETNSLHVTPYLIKSPPAFRTPTPPVISIVPPSTAVSTLVSTQVSVSPTTTPTVKAGGVTEDMVKATVTPTSTPTSTPTDTPTPVPTSTPTAAARPTPFLPVITKIFGPVVAHGSVNTSVLRLRYGPSSTNDTVVFLFSGTLLDIFGKSPDGNWLGVRVTGANLYGWVYARYIRIDKWETGDEK